ncbi:MAG: extracellular solute-binding protein, partial [Pseudomonadota bacterium]
NDLVEKYPDTIRDNMLIRIGDNIMAIAFMANSQHLFSRTDILEQAGVDGIPATWGEVLEAAEAIRAAGIMEHPIVMNMQVGWNLGEAFNLVYAAHGGAYFEAGSAAPAINSAEALATLELMAQIVEYTNPDFLSQASNETQAAWEAGQAALGMMWGSRGAVVLDDEGSTAEVTENTVLSAAPTLDGGSIPGATLWWDGITIAANVSDEEAEATFAALVGAMTSDMVAEHNDDAVWLIDGFQPGPSAAGVAATAQGGAPAYPMFPQMGLMHGAIDGELGAFLQGDRSAEDTLAAIEAAYVTAATEAGFLQ